MFIKIPFHKDSFKQDFELVDAFMISKRYEEELVQVPKEMNEFLKQVKNLIELLEQDISTTGLFQLAIRLKFQSCIKIKNFYSS